MPLGRSTSRLSCSKARSRMPKSVNSSPTAPNLKSLMATLSPKLVGRKETLMSIRSSRKKIDRRPSCGLSVTLIFTPANSFMREIIFSHNDLSTLATSCKTPSTRNLTLMSFSSASTWMSEESDLTAAAIIIVTISVTCARLISPCKSLKLDNFSPYLFNSSSVIFTPLTTSLALGMVLYIFRP